MDILISVTLAGLVRGLLYFLLASGLSLIFGVLNVINLAHASFYMIGVYVAFTIASLLNWWWALLLVPLIVAAFGLIIEFVIFRRVYKAAHEIQMLVGFALVYVFGDLVMLTWGPAFHLLAAPPGFEGAMTIGNLVIPRFNLLIVALSIFAIVILWLVLYRSKLGNMIRGCAIDGDMCSALGVRVPFVFATTFGIACYLAGLAGVVAAPLMGVCLGMDWSMLLVAFAIVIVGGIGNIWGTLMHL